MWHIYHTVQTAAPAGWVFIVDNLNTHCSESLVRYVARVEQIDESRLGQKGKSGILASMALRQACGGLNRGGAQTVFVRLAEDVSKCRVVAVRGMLLSAVPVRQRVFAQRRSEGSAH